MQWLKFAFSDIIGRVYIFESNLWTQQMTFIHSRQHLKILKTVIVDLRNVVCCNFPTKLSGWIQIPDLLAKSTWSSSDSFSLCANYNNKFNTKIPIFQRACYGEEFSWTLFKIHAKCQSEKCWNVDPIWVLKSWQAYQKPPHWKVVCY